VTVAGDLEFLLDDRPANALEPLGASLRSTAEVD